MPTPTTMKQASNTTAPALDAPFTLANGQTIKNRIAKAAMAEQMGDRHFLPRPELYRLYRTWAEGGVGLMITGNVMVDAAHQGEMRNIVLDDTQPLEPFQRWAEAAHQQDAKIWMQINHPGKQIPMVLNREPVAPSAVPLAPDLQAFFATPRALEESEILAIIQRFATTARRAQEAGFDGVEIHAAHGYLINQFLSPLHNQRTDRWGGSLENRMRFLLDTYHAIRAAVGEGFAVAVKLNSADFMQGGFSEDDSMRVVSALAEAGVDLIEVSGGTYEKPAMVDDKARPSTLRREAYFLDYAARARALVDTPLMVTGGFRSGQAMQQAIAGGAVDFIGAGRLFALYPDMPAQVLSNADARFEVTQPSTGIDALDKASMMATSWFANQLERIGKGRTPLPRLSAWRSLLSTFLKLGRHSFQRVRA